MKRATQWLAVFGALFWLVTAPCLLLWVALFDGPDWAALTGILALPVVFILASAAGQE